jgi:CDP-diacylglycerol--glycerol-3-phosphate 3-phosphatidyltransferase
MRREFLTPSNILSLLRVVLVIPFVAVMLSGLPSARLWGGAVMILGGLTDRYDGILARMYGYETEWGRILDPLADKIGVGAVALVLLHLGDLPLWYVIGVLARDVLIFLGGLFLKIRRALVLPSNLTGKWAVGITSLALFLLVLGGRSTLAWIALAASALLLLTSFGLYVLRFVRELRQPGVS